MFAVSIEGPSAQRSVSIAESVVSPRLRPGPTASGDTRYVISESDLDDTVSFDAFYERHRNEIAASLAFTLGGTSLAEEAVDEAMARAYQRWDEVAGYANPAGWVYRVGLNWGRSWRRSMARRRRRERFVMQGEYPAVSPMGAGVELMDALGQLSVDHRAVIVLRYFNDWSVKETAEALEIGEGTVKSRSSRALEQLRSALDDGSGGVRP
jgi:RNA polymerase sigma-70 factor (ECF subfamily)